MKALDHARLHTAALLHELAHLHTRAGAGAPAFPYPEWYQPDLLPAEIVARVTQTHYYALGQEPMAPASMADVSLQPILATLAGSSTPNRLLPTALQVDETAFPAAPLSPSEYQAACRALWAELCAAAAEIRHLPAAEYPQRLRPLLEWHTSNVSGPDGPRDLSWYVRAHTRAAFALALAEQPFDGGQQLLLLGGELSGIQGFLYDIGSTLAAKLLKGRSFYLHLLCDSIRLHVLQALGLDEGQTLIDSGGRFLLLVPVQETSVIDTLREIIEAQLWKNHREKLGFHLASVSMDPADLLRAGGLSECLSALEAALQAARRRPMASLIALYPGLLFTPQGQGGAVRRDDLTGQELSLQEAAQVRDIRLEEEDQQELRVSEVTWLQLELGKQLKGAAYWLTRLTAPDAGDEEYWVQPLGLTVWHRLVNEKAELKYFLRPGTRVRRINPGSFDEAKAGFVWYGGAKFPLNGEEIATFDEVASLPASEEESHAQRGRALVRLAHLRMDVDDLGIGLRRNQQSLTRYIAISRALDLFFKGHLEWLRDQPVYRDHTVLVYAGGDDLYAVGAWDVVARWAMAVRENFRRYCGGGMLPGISGGIVLTGRRHPVAHAAQLAGEAERAAKAHVLGGSLKDSLCLFDQPLRWGEELPQLQGLRDQLEGFIQKGILNPGLLQKLMRHHTDSIAQSKASKVEDTPPLQRWQFTAAWDLVRYREVLEKRLRDAKSDREALRTALQFLQDHILELYNGPASIADLPERVTRLGIAARWAELRLRSGVVSDSTNLLIPQS